MKKYFEGWYFRHEKDGENLIFIPSIYYDKKGNGRAQLQIISGSGVHIFDYDIKEVKIDRKELKVNMGKNIFSLEGCVIDIDGHRGEMQPSIYCELKYSRTTPVEYDVMGPFAKIPFMECRHSVFSMNHFVSGKAEVNGESINFPGRGYIEGDRGRSFPSNYAWTQAFLPDGSAIMVSIGEIPYLWKRFRGVIAVIYWEGQEYRLATYKGAKVKELSRRMIKIEQEKLNLTVELKSALLPDKKTAHVLQAPVKGQMARFIREHTACIVRYTLKNGDKTIFDMTSDEAVYEYEY